MKSKKIEDFKFEFSLSGRTSHRIKRAVLKLVTKKSMPVFTKSKDLISESPQVDGFHEAEIKELMNFLATQQNYSDFLLDIGANIGLISCQSGKLFKEVHLFEPNPDCVHILKVNTRINLNNRPHFIHEFGLGIKDETCKLFVPINNWGGAFIRSESNSYSDDELANKDNFDDINAKNYLISEVEIKNAETIFSKLFEEIQRKGLSKGVVKIDVEGCEEVILNAIFKVLPKGFKLAIIFENLSKENTYQKLITNNFREDSRLFQISKRKVASSFFIKLISKVVPFFKQHKIYYLKPIESKLDKGNFLLLLSK